MDIVGFALRFRHTFYARQTTVDRRLDDWGSKEGERERHADRAFRLALPGGDCFDDQTRIGHQFVEPAMGKAKRFDEGDARLDPHRPNREVLIPLALNDLAPPIGRRRRPGNGQDPSPSLEDRCARQSDLDQGSADDDALDGVEKAFVWFGQVRTRVDLQAELLRFGGAGNLRPAKTGVRDETIWRVARLMPP
jgi:hypothetical protein